MEKFCQNPYCETPAVREVSVSVNKPSDQVRAVCATCEEAYTWGVQHGKKVSLHRKVWILAIADRGIIAHVTAHNSKAEAEKGIIEYLREHECYDCAGDVDLAYLYLSQHDERLSVEIIPQEVCFKY